MKLYETSKHYVSHDNELFGKLVSSLESPVTFDERFKVNLGPCFIPDLNLLSCELVNSTLTVLF